MLDFSTSSEQYPDPDREEILKIIEEMKIAIIKQFLLLTEPGTTKLLPVTNSDSGRVIANYLSAFECTHQQVIPTAQSLVPREFSGLIQSNLEEWIPLPKIYKKEPP